MAKIMKKILAMFLVTALCIAQITVPAFASGDEGQSAQIQAELPQDAQPPESTAEQNVEVQVDLSQHSQVPESTSELKVTEQEPVVTNEHDEGAGVFIDSTSTTTDWTGTEGNTQVTGSETSTEYTLTDDYTGQVLVEGGTLEGTESKETVTETTETETETVTTGVTEVTSTTETTETSSTSESSGEVEGETIEGQWDQPRTEVDMMHSEADDIDQIGESQEVSLDTADLPEDGVTIILRPDPQNPGKFIGSADGGNVDFQIPEGAEPIYEDGVLIGYKQITRQDTEVKETKREVETNTEEDHYIDSIPEITDVTPDRSSFEHLLTDDSVVTEEYDENDPTKVTGYIITNTTENTTTGTGIQMPQRPADGTSTDENGNTVTITSTDVTDADGNVIGYSYRQVVTDADGNVLQDATTTLTMDTNELPAPAEPQITFTLPQKPAQSDTTDAEGNRTLVTVEDIYDESGKHVGYKEITVLTDSEGNELFRETHDTYGTETIAEQDVSSGQESCTASWTMTTTTTDTYRVTAQEKLYEDLALITERIYVEKDTHTTTEYQIVEIGDRLYILYTGEMSVSEGSAHGNIDDLVPIAPDSELFEYDGSQNLKNGNDNVVNDTSSNDDGFKYIGHGIASNLLVNYNNTYVQTNQFRLKAPNGDIFYAMCIDLDTSIQAGHLYEIDDIKEASYLADGTIEKIRSIALNGYWGTKSGVGNLEELKDFVEDYLKNEKKLSQSEVDQILDSLTHGQALSATQAALWTYGDSGGNKVKLDDLIRGNDEEDERNAKAVYDALIAAANDPTAELDDDEGVEFLDADDITGGAITIKSKIIDPENPDVDTNQYNTDLSFTLGIEHAKLFGDLIVTVSVPGQQDVKYRLCGEDTILPLGRLTPDENGVYTIPNVQLAPGITVNLNLSGTQDLGTGVYIYTSLEGQFSASQTLVTLASGNRSVDLDLNMSFQVEDPVATATKYKQRSGYAYSETTNKTRTDTTPRSEIVTTIEHTTKTNETYKAELVCTAEATITTTTTEQTEENRAWFASWEEEVEQEPVQQDDDSEIPTEPTEPDKPKDVPQSDIPQTGDPTVLLAMLSLSSLGGLALLSRKKKEN